MMGKMSWYHISDVKKTDMVTMLICQLPDYDAFGRLGQTQLQSRMGSRPWLDCE